MGNAHFDIERMKTCASHMEQELNRYREAETNLNEIISNLSGAWDDSTFRHYTANYRTYVSDAVSETGRVLDQYTKLMYTAAKRYGNAIDNGNSYLSE